MNHTDRNHRDPRLSKQPRRDAAWKKDGADYLLPWADPYITSLFDEHRRDSPWSESSRKSPRDEMAESHSYWNASR